MCDKQIKTIFLKLVVKHFIEWLVEKYNKLLS